MTPDKIMSLVDGLFRLGAALGQLVARGKHKEAAQILDGQLITSVNRAKAEAEAELHYQESHDE
jgi:hypothetical protein